MKTIHLIGNAHLDPVWLWQWQEGFLEVKATFRSALDRMKEFPDFKFTSACSAYYMWVEKSDPEMFREIQERVKEGRWSIVGGWFMVTQTLHRLFPKKITYTMHVRMIYIYVAIAVIVINCLMKNLWIVAYGVYMMGSN